MSAGPPRWTWRSMSSTACWSWDARATSASPNLDGAGVLAPTPRIRATHLLGAVGAVAAGLGARLFGSTSEAKDTLAYPVSYSEAEWKQRLTPEQYRVPRPNGTERAGTSPRNAEKRNGTFVCAGGAQPLFTSDTK